MTDITVTQQQVEPNLLFTLTGKTATEEQCDIGRLYTTGASPIFTLNGYPTRPTTEYWYLKPNLGKLLDPASTDANELITTISFSGLGPQNAQTAELNVDSPSQFGTTPLVFFQDSPNRESFPLWARTKNVLPPGLRQTSLLFSRKMDADINAVLQIMLDRAKRIIGIFWYQAGTSFIAPAGDFSNDTPEAVNTWLEGLGSGLGHVSTALPQLVFSIQSGANAGSYLGFADPSSLKAGFSVKIQSVPALWSFDPISERIKLTNSVGTRCELVLQGSSTNGGGVTVAAKADSNLQNWSWPVGGVGGLGTVQGTRFLFNGSGTAQNWAASSWNNTNNTSFLWKLV